MEGIPIKYLHPCIIVKLTGPIILKIIKFYLRHTNLLFSSLIYTEYATSWYTKIFPYNISLRDVTELTFKFKIGAENKK